MKAKRLLSAFVAVAMMVTMLVSFSAVTYAEGEASMNISFVELTEDEIAELEASFDDPVVLVPEGTTPYWFIVTLSDYGTLSSKSTGAGTKLGSFQAKLKFDGQVTDYIERETTGEYWWALDMGEIGMASMGISELATDGVPGTTLSVSWAGNTTGKTCWPTGTVNGREDEVILCQLPVAVKKGFTATVTEGLYEIKTYTSNTAFTNESFYGSKGQVTLQESVTVGTPEPPALEPSIGATTKNENAGVNADGFVYDNCWEIQVSLTNPKAATRTGVQFIPKTVLTTANDSWATAAEAVFDAAKLGDGTASYRAAIINIPSFLAGEAFTMCARAFAEVTGEDTLYGDVVEQEITYTKTAEPSRD